MNKKETVTTSFRLTPVCKRLLEQLAERAGVTVTAYIETVAREKAKAEGIEINPT